MPRIWELYLGKQAGYVIGATDLDPPHGCRKRRLRLVGQPAAPDLHGARHRPSRSADVPVCPSPIRASAPPEQKRDRKSVVQGKSVSVSVDPGGRRLIKKKIQ